MADVIIIGGGPAGSMTGSYLSRAGVDNLIIEKVMHPRRHIGESMVPSTTRNFDDVGFLPVMERERFPRKYGAAWHPTSAKGEVSIVFAEFPQPGVDQDYTYHVDRGKLDHLLLQHAKSLGSKIIQGVAVKEVLFDDDDYACGVRVDIEDEERVQAGVGIWYEFIRLYYKLMHLFTFFIQSKEYRQQIHALLQGEVYDRGEAPVLDAMRNIIRTVESTPGHLWAPYLTDMPID